MLSFGCDQKEIGTEEEAQEIAQRMKKYAVKEIAFNASEFTENEKKLLITLIEVARLSDEIYWQQTAANNGLLENLRQKRSKEDPLRKFAELQAGPYDRLDNDAPFMDVPEKAASAGFYPSDLTRDEFDTWLVDHPDDREAFLSPYSVIRRRGQALVSIPYSQEYKKYIVPMVNKLRYAATLTEDKNFRAYLHGIAEALITDNYQSVKSDWVGMQNNKIDFLIGPFDTKDDKLNSIKTSFEATVDIVDLDAGNRIASLTSRLRDLEDNLPYPNRYKNKDVKVLSCYAVVSDIYRGGEKRVDYRQRGSILPTDTKVCEVKGVKKTIWRNALAARLEEIIAPLSSRLIAGEQTPYVTVSGFYQYVLLREITQNLGPRTIYLQDKPVEEALDDHYGWIEQAKADVTSLYSLPYLKSIGEADQKLVKEMTVSYLGRLFQTLRLANTDPQSKAAAVVLNYLLEYGGIEYDKGSKKYAIDFDKIDTSLALLANELLIIEAEGDFERAQKLVLQYGTLPDFVSSSLESVQDLPLVVAPLYQVIWN
ncbi:MAG: hypothetical protein ACE5I1_06865 [bacterium]